MEADTAGERTQIVNEYKIKSGLPLFGSNCMPLCYEVGQPENGERHKYIAKRDKELMEDLIAHVMVNHSVRAAMVYVNNKYERAYGYNAIMGALTNEMICGMYKGNPNYCPAYITRDMFDKLQKIIKRNPRTAGGEHAYYFTGLIRCPECGRRLNGGSHVTKHGTKAYRYYTYRCANNTINKQCGYNKVIFEARLERMMLEQLNDIIAHKKARSIEIKAKGEKVGKYNLKELQEELDRLNYSWKKGRIKSVEKYDRDYDEIMEKINAAHEEHASETVEPDYEKIEAVLSGGWQEIYKALDDEHKRAFWRSFVEEIQLDWNVKAKEIKDVIFF